MEANVSAVDIARIDTAKLGIAIRLKRGNRTFREIAPESGVKYRSLHMIERGAMPSLTTYTQLCKWLGVEMEYFVVTEAAQ